MEGYFRTTWMAHKHNCQRQDCNRHDGQLAFNSEWLIQLESVILKFDFRQIDECMDKQIFVILEIVAFMTENLTCNMI